MVHVYVYLLYFLSAQYLLPILTSISTAVKPPIYHQVPNWKPPLTKYGSAESRKMRLKQGLTGSHWFCTLLNLSMGKDALGWATMIV